MNVFDVIILSLVQGITEILPVSSSAHVIFVEKCLGLNPSTPAMVLFLVSLHSGTTLGVFISYYKRWKQAGKAFWLLAFLSTVVTLGVGLVLKILLEHFLGSVESLFKQLPLIALALTVAATMILASSWYPGRLKGIIPKLSKVLTVLQVPQMIKSWKIPTNEISHAVCIGLIQGFCLPFRGLSRSGVTISMGVLLGNSFAKAEAFSFLLSLMITPVVILYSIRKVTLSELTIEELNSTFAACLIGFVLSAIAGTLSAYGLSSILAHRKWIYFSYYAFLLALFLAFQPFV